jgi:hypothetical protein
MSPERSHAYKRVMYTLDQLGPSKLLLEEQDRIRYAADILIFSGDLTGEEASAALADALTLCEALVQSGRWERVTATRLADDISACGPMLASEAAVHAA